jgi:hypothetical protein
MIGHEEEIITMFSKKPTQEKQKNLWIFKKFA